MSRKYKKATQTRSVRQATPTPVGISQGTLEALSALYEDSAASKLKLKAEDGYANPAAFLGESSTLFSAGSFKRSFITSQTDQLTTAYRESWLAKKIIDMPTDDMTRSWYSLSTNLSDDDIRDLRRLEAKYGVKRDITNAIRWARLYGGSVAIIVIRGDDNAMDQPLDLDSLGPGCFQGLIVADRLQGIDPSIEIVKDFDDPDFGLPEYYTVSFSMEGMNSMRIHHSRILRFVGRELPRYEMIAESYWGASELEHIWEELQKRSATSANIAQLIFQANITTLKMSDFGENLAMGTANKRQKIIQALEAENRLRTSYGLQILSADDSMETHSYTFAGISDIYEAFMMDMAGASEIPATKLFGRSPQGFNSTGESDLLNYYDMITGLQERMLRPALEKLLPIMACSCWGFVPEEMDIVFEPVQGASPEKQAEMIQKLSSDVITAFEKGLITRPEALKELKARGNRLGLWDKLPEEEDSKDPEKDPEENPEAELPEENNTGWEKLQELRKSGYCI